MYALILQLVSSLPFSTQMCYELIYLKIKSRKHSSFTISIFFYRADGIIENKLRFISAIISSGVHSIKVTLKWTPILVNIINFYPLACRCTFYVYVSDMSSHLL